MNALLQERRALFGRVCRRLDVPWSARTANGTRQVPWDGLTLHGMVREAVPGVRRVRWKLIPFRMWDLWHDLAHWLVAEPEHRKYVGFGQGPAYDLGADHLRADGPTVSCAYEEDASAVGIVLQNTFEGRRRAEAHADYHDWGDFVASIQARGAQRQASYQAAVNFYVECSSGEARSTGVRWAESQLEAANIKLRT